MKPEHYTKICVELKHTRYTDVRYCFDDADDIKDLKELVDKLHERGREKAEKLRQKQEYDTYIRLHNKFKDLSWEERKKIGD